MLIFIASYISVFFNDTIRYYLELSCETLWARFINKHYGLTQPIAIKEKQALTKAGRRKA